ncbi:hypothetical protein K470DRAFT_261839 [Piedraia hortae CBS 480.64]|uniref:Uncharacterized protein n=1 Tax=Piedraia hortae CBS 480.64 TaxID=1314780 RepID=A0A6A7C8K4_9PEZI|nr:hypothetical protein K470DRAFT_261839 [Piedraia hortae CBS 480.64]
MFPPMRICKGCWSHLVIAQATQNICNGMQSAKEIDILDFAIARTKVLHLRSCKQPPLDGTLQGIGIAHDVRETTLEPKFSNSTLQLELWVRDTFTEKLWALQSLHRKLKTHAQVLRQVAGQGNAKEDKGGRRKKKPMVENIFPTTDPSLLKIGTVKATLPESVTFYKVECHASA